MNEIDELRKRLDQESEGWRPEPGDEIAGEIVGLSETKGDYEAYPVVTIRTEDGVFDVHCFHTVLKGQIAEKQPRIGDLIGIKYFGKKEPKRGGSSYEHYRTELVRKTSSETTPNWGAIASDARDQADDEGIDEDVF